MRVGAVGLGQMGMPIVQRIRSAGLDVGFVARQAATIEQACALGAVQVSGFRDHDIVVICLYSDTQLLDVGPQVLESMDPGSILVIHTTCSPTTVGLLDDLARGHSIELLDAAISGSPDDATNGRLTLLVGGDEQVLERARPLLLTYSETILHVGAIGDGQRVKLINNALLGAQIRLAAEAEARRHGTGSRLSHRTRCDPALQRRQQGPALHSDCGLSRSIGQSCGSIHREGRERGGGKRKRCWDRVGLARNERISTRGPRGDQAAQSSVFSLYRHEGLDSIPAVCSPMTVGTTFHRNHRFRS